MNRPWPRKPRCRRPFAAAGALLALLLCVAGPASGAEEGAAESGCVAAARGWIRALDDPENAELLLRYARGDCTFSGSYVKKYGNAEGIHRERTCNDLVLIWTHKDCGFFRDQVNPAAYEPCKAWSREMYRRCMEDDTDWFF